MAVGLKDGGVGRGGGDGESEESDDVLGSADGCTRGRAKVWLWEGGVGRRGGKREIDYEIKERERERERGRDGEGKTPY